MLLHTWAPQCLRNAGLQVVETSGWTNRSHGSFPDSIFGVHHHDASPPGDSPGALDWMINSWDEASANFWVNRYGVWHCVGTGVAWHAGVVLSGMPNNFNSFGVETDQTINETPTQALLDSVTRGFAALLKEMGRNNSSYFFHKTLAPWRKQDPWLGPSSADSNNWNNELADRRNVVQSIMNGGGTPIAPVTPPATPTPMEDDEEMKSNVYRTAADPRCWSVGPGFVNEITDAGPFIGSEYLRIGLERGQFTPVQIVEPAELDILKYNALHNQGKA